MADTEAIETAHQILNHLDREDAEGALEVVQGLTLEQMEQVKNGLTLVVLGIEAAQIARGGKTDGPIA